MDGIDAFVKAYEDIPLLNRDELRPVRLMLLLMVMGLPVAATVKAAVCPAAGWTTVTGWVVNAGSALDVTVSVAALDVMTARPLATTQRYWWPLKPEVAGGVT